MVGKFFQPEPRSSSFAWRVSSPFFPQDHISQAAGAFPGRRCPASCQIRKMRSNCWQLQPASSGLGVQTLAKCDLGLVVFSEGGQSQAACTLQRPSPTFGGLRLPGALRARPTLERAVHPRKRGAWGWDPPTLHRPGGKKSPERVRIAPPAGPGKPREP